MAGKRMISTGLPESEKMMDCSSDTVRLLFVWLCLAVDDDGYMQCKPRTIKQKFYGYRDDILIDDCDKFLKEICELELLVYYKEKNNHKSYIFIPGWQDINVVRMDIYKPSEIPIFNASNHEPLHNCNVDVTWSLPRLGKVSKDKVRKDQNNNTTKTLMFEKFTGLTENQIEGLFKKFEYKFINKDLFLSVLKKIHDRTKEKKSYGLKWFKKCLDNFNFADEGMLETVQNASKSSFNTEGIKKVLDKIG